MPLFQKNISAVCKAMQYQYLAPGDNNYDDLLVFINDHQSVLVDDIRSNGSFIINAFNGCVVIHPGDYVTCGVGGNYFSTDPKLFEREWEPSKT